MCEKDNHCDFLSLNTEKKGSLANGCGGYYRCSNLVYGVACTLYETYAVRQINISE